MTTAEPIHCTLKLPRLYPKQMAAIFAPERYSVTEATTKSGKTVGCMVWLLAECWKHGGEGREFWWIAPVYPQAAIAYRRTKRMLGRMDPERRIWDHNETDMTLTIKGRGTLRYKTAEKPDNLFGEDVYAAVIDEATRVKEEAWHAIRSTLTSTRGPIRIIGNVKGRKNWAYRMARKAEAGARNMSHHKLTAYDAIEGGVLTAEEVEDARETLPEAVFRELYLAEPADDEGNPFGLAAIRRCVGELAPGPPAYWGVDLAKHTDWTVAVALNDEGNVCGFQRWQSDWQNTTARLAAMIDYEPAEVDSTGVGDPIVEELQRRCSRVAGYRFTAGPTGKQQLMEGLAVAIQRQEITYPAGVIVDELESFEYEVRIVNGRITGVRYSAPEGLHDDCVCALALAVRCMREAGGGRLDFSVAGTTEREDRIEQRWLDSVEDEAIWQ